VQVKLQLLYRDDLFKDENLLTQNSGSIQEADNRQLAAGLQNTWHFPTPDWIDHSGLKLTLRYDRIRLQNLTDNRIDTYLSPQIGLYLGSEQAWLWKIQTNYGYSFRSPTFADLYYQDFRVRGNATLQPEKSRDFDAGIRLGLPWLRRPEFAITYFRQAIDDLIVWELGSFATWQPINLDAFIEGLEYEFDWSPWPDHLSFNLNHIFLNARNRSNRHTTHDRYLTYRPAHTTRLGFDFEYDFFKVTYQRRIVSERFVTAANTVALPGYKVDDITLWLKYVLGPLHGSLRAMLLNVFDTRYEIVRDAPLPGRQWRIGLDVVY